MRNRPRPQKKGVRNEESNDQVYDGGRETESGVPLFVLPGHKANEALRLSASVPSMQGEA